MAWMQKSTLRTSLVAIVVAALIPMLVLLIAQSFNARGMARELVQERLMAEAMLTAAGQKEALNMTRRALINRSHVDEVRRMSPQCNQAIVRGFASQRVMTNIIRSDRNGVARCAIVPLAPGTAISNQHWWQNGKAATDFTLNVPVQMQAVQRRAMIAMLPLYDTDGAFDGALTAALDVSWIAAALDAQRLAPDAVAAIADRSGRFLIVAGPSRLPRVGPIFPDRRKGAVKGSDQTMWMYAAAPLFKNELYVVYAQPEQSLMGTIRDQFVISLILPLLGMFAAAVTIWWAANRFVIRWLRMLATDTATLARGNDLGDGQSYDAAPSEIASLAADISDMAKSVDERDSSLRQAAEEARLMVREVNHRTKNNLQLVLSIINLQMGRQRPGEAAHSALDKARVRIGAIAMIHRFAYEGADGAERGSVDMDVFTPALCATFGRGGPDQGVRIMAQSHLGRISLDLAVPLALLIVEAVTNALVHGLSARRGAVQVVLDRQGRDGVLTVTDTGIGFDPETEQGLGITLMKAYASQIRGNLAIERTGQGTIVTLGFTPT